MKQIIKHVKEYEKHLHAASSTENTEENTSRHGLARKIFLDRPRDSPQPQLLYKRKGNTYNLFNQSQRLYIIPYNATSY